MRGAFPVQLKQLATDVAHVAQSRIEHLKKEIQEAEQLRFKAQASLTWQSPPLAKSTLSNQRSGEITSVPIVGFEEILALP